MANFNVFNMAEAMQGGQNLALGHAKMNEVAHSLAARAGLQDAVSAGTPEALEAYKKRFPTQGLEYEGRLFERAKGIREQQKFSQDQQKQNTEWLFGATSQIVDSKNPTLMANYFLGEAKKRGLVKPDFQWGEDGPDLEAIKQLRDQAKVSLGGAPDPGHLEKVVGQDGKEKFVRRGEALGMEPHSDPKLTEIHDP
jgi:hypothetical protein